LFDPEDNEISEADFKLIYYCKFTYYTRTNKFHQKGDFDFEIDTTNTLINRENSVEWTYYSRVTGEIAACRLIDDDHNYEVLKSKYLNECRTLTSIIDVQINNGANDNEIEGFILNKI